MVERGFELRIFGFWATYALVAERAEGAGILQCVELELEVLVGGADSGVSDGCHDACPVS